MASAKVTNCVWILGATDPEMQEIEALLRARGEDVRYAMIDGRRVMPGNAYKADSIAVEKEVITVECFVGCEATKVDHHNEGDYGYGLPSNRYWEASSIGQVCAILSINPTPELRMVAAADHCLAAAYRGECPGVDPDELMLWRVNSRATFQKRSPDMLLADIAETRMVLRSTLQVKLNDSVMVVDMRRDPPYPELPEAAAREGVGYIAGPLVDRDGRRKITCSGTAEQVRAFMQDWAPQNGLVDVYGDPERGFAGGYEAK